MARRIINQVWPVQDLSVVCNLQNTTGAGSLILNGTLGSLLYPNTPVSFLNAGSIAQNIALTNYFTTKITTSTTPATDFINLTFMQG